MGNPHTQEIPKTGQVRYVSPRTKEKGEGGLGLQRAEMQLTARWKRGNVCWATQKQTWDLERNFNKLTFLNCSLSTTSSSSYNVVVYGDSSLSRAFILNSLLSVVGREGLWADQSFFLSLLDLDCFQLKIYMPLWVGASWGGLPLAPEVPSTLFESSFSTFALMYMLSNLYIEVS